MAAAYSCDGPKRLRISWSQVKVHEECRQKSMLQRHQKKNPATDIRNFFHGRVCDQIMREWLDEPDPQPNVMPSRVGPYIDRLAQESKDTGDGVVRWRTAADRRQMTKMCEEALECLEPMLNKWVLPYDYQPEYRFTQPIRIPYLDGSLAEIDIIGGMDILVRRSKSPLHFYAHDLKITEDPAYVSKMFGQGVFYDLATMAEFAVPLQQFSFLSPAVKPPGQTVTPLNVSEQMRADMMTRITRVAHARWREDYAPKAEHDGCSWCNVKHACIKFNRSAAVFAPKLGRVGRGRTAHG